MRCLTDLDADALKVALESSDAMLRFKAYLPPGGLLVVLLGRFRDGIRDVLSMERDPPARRGREHRSLDELTSVELDTVAGAVGILLDRFVPSMDDPALPRLLTEFSGADIEVKPQDDGAQVMIGLPRDMDSDRHMVRFSIGNGPSVLLDQFLTGYAT